MKRACSINANTDENLTCEFYPATISEEAIATIVANSTERFINENKFCQGKFKWQDTCSAFSVSKADVEKVCNYIYNRPEHHRKISYAEEYETFMKFYQKMIKPK